MKTDEAYLIRCLVDGRFNSTNDYWKFADLLEFVKCNAI